MTDSGAMLIAAAIIIGLAVHGAFLVMACNRIATRMANAPANSSGRYAVVRVISNNEFLILDTASASLLKMTGDEIKNMKGTSYSTLGAEAMLEKER